MTRPLELTDVTVGYGDHVVLRDVSFTLGPGVSFLVGENGAGKTTLFKVVLGDLEPIAGRVELDGVELAGAARETFLRGVGYLPQTFRFPAHLEVGDFLRYMGWLRQLPRKRLEPAAREALAAVGLADHWHDRLGALSGGMVRRVGVAQAVMHRPAVLLLDEPTVGLDPTARVEFRGLLSELGRSTAVLCSTHLLEDASTVGGRLIALHQGRVAYEGSTDELVRRAAREPLPGMSALESAFLDLVGHGGTGGAAS